MKRKQLISGIGRAGLLSRAAIWLVMGALAARLALEGRTKQNAEPDKHGALETLARQRVGWLLLLVLFLGFLAMVTWSAVEAIRGREGDDDAGIAHRLVAVGRGVAYAVLAASTLPLLLGDGGSDGDSQERLTARVLGWPGGRILVGALAAALSGAAAYNLFRAISGRYKNHWDERKTDANARRIASVVEVAGNVGHAMVFGLVGWFLLQAAWRFDGSKPKSLDESLAALVRQSNGRAVCALVALGMAAWGVNALAQARWREIPARA